MSELSETECANKEATYYLPDTDLVAAAQVALELGQPLLLTGEPGTGKTTFANHLATHLAPDFFVEKGGQDRPSTFPLHTFETKSTSVANDLFYRFDSLRRFHAVHDQRMSADNIDYVTFEALGMAILESLPWNEVADLVPNKEAHQGPRRAVVLIDEIDKAPRDFPNDLLNEIDKMFFRIPEVTQPGTRRVRSLNAPDAFRPIIILTSNSEKNLPAPFLRRCVFHHIRFPDRDNAARLTAIVNANLAKDLGKLSESAISFFYDIREELQHLDKLPTTYELVQWIRVLHARRQLAGEFDIRQTPIARLPTGYLKSTLGVIAKTANDLVQVEALVHRRFDVKVVA